MSPQETALVAGTELAPLPGPGGLPERDMAEVWTGGFIHSISLRDAQPPRPGRARAWVRADHPLVEGEDAGELARFLIPVDAANGIAVREHPREWMYPNLDLTIHLTRRPTGQWTGLDTTVTFGHTGQGLTSSILHDEQGPLGSVQQSLTVRPLPPGA
jgi:hypothetical protein